MTPPARLFMTVDAVGGVWQYATELAGALAPLGYRATLALLGPAPSAAQRRTVAAIAGATLLETGLALDWLAPDAAAVAAAGTRIAALARAAGADIVQLNQPALAAFARFDAPVVAVAHSCVASWWAAVEGGEPPADFAWRTRLAGAGLARADAVVCPSRSFAADIARIYRLRPAPHVVHNGRSRPGGTSGASHDFAFTAGRLWDRGKNVATLDRAAGRLGVPVRAAGPLAGPNGERIVLEHLHALGGIDERTLADCLAARPVFVSAARYEPFGLAVLEAALAGCPLILSDIPTFRELWDDAAVFVAPDDDAGFAEAIAALIGDAGARRARGDRARGAAARFTPARMAAGMADIYRRAGAARRRSAAA